jgi:hypothetical protein
MAKPARTTKVLRIGVIQDGKIVQERIVKANENVTVGESPKASFALPKGQHQGPDFLLFPHGPQGYSLRFTESMKGRVSTHGQVAAIQKLIGSASVTKQGDVYTVPLQEQDRGKVQIGNVTVLFQFVAPPPPQAVRPMDEKDFRARLVAEDDPAFLGFLGLWTALAAVLLLWMTTVEIKPRTLKDMPERMVKLIIPPKVVPPVAPTPEPGKQPAKAKSSESKTPTENEAKAPPVRSDEQVKNDLIQRSKLLLKLIGTTGESASVTDTVWGDRSVVGDIDAALRTTDGTTTVAGQATTRGGAGVDGSVTDIGDLATVGGGAAAVAAGPAVKPRVNTDSSGTVDEDIADSDCVKHVVIAKSGQLQYCYEKRLNEVPDLGGRIEVGWSIGAGGIVESVYIVANATGDDVFGECVKGKVKKWSFAQCAESSGDVSWGFAFTSKD